jgi:hypothetical protein
VCPRAPDARGIGLHIAVRLSTGPNGVTIGTTGEVTGC